MAQRDNWIGVDVGGTNVRAAVLDGRRRLLSWVSFPHQGGNGQSAFVADAASQAVREAGLDWNDIAGMGVAIAGLVDSPRGIVLHSANLAWRDLPLGVDLERRFGLPVILTTDVGASALAELNALPGGAVSPWLYFSVGTGIGACVMLDGPDRSTGCVIHIGHAPIPGGSLRCHCGELGCLETVASGWAIAREAADRIVGPARLAGRAVPTMNARDVAAAALEGDGVAQSILAEAGRACGEAVAHLVNLLSPAGVGLGGGVVVAGSHFLAALNEAAVPLIRSWERGALPFQCSVLGDRAGVAGGADIARLHVAGGHSKPTHS